MPLLRAFSLRAALLAVLVIGCAVMGVMMGASGCVARDVSARGDGGDEADSSAPQIEMPTCSALMPCAAGTRCHQGLCIADNGTCATDDDCQNDSYCDCPVKRDGGSVDGGVADGCVCVPWGVPPRASYDPACRAPPFDVADIVPPAVICSSGGGAETTPVVADLDGDGRPEVIYLDVGYGFHAMHGADCSPYFDQMFGFAEWNASQIAVADLDADGVPEIIGVDRGQRVAVFDNHGRVLSSVPVPYEFTGGEGGDLGGPLVVDLDGHAPPEILMGAQAMRYVSKPMPAIKALWQKVPVLPFWGALTIAADLDGDHLPEVISGKQIFRAATGDEITPKPLAALQGPGAFAAVADMNGDGKPDLVLVQSGATSQRVSVYDYANQAFLFGPLDAPHGWGGAATVADFDGDGKPEFGVASIHDYTVYDLACLGTNRPAKCDPTTPGVLFRKHIEDNSSGSCAAVAFDINGDGAAEVIYRDECWLRAYDGRNGHTLFALSAPSGTGLEEPVVADLDGDGHAEIIVAVDGYPSCGVKADPDTGTKWKDLGSGVLVLGDPSPMKRYMPARALFNEHAYHITNVEDDLSVPEHEADSWRTWNSYRGVEQGIAGSPAGIADLTARLATHADPSPMDCAAAWTLVADVCNRGGGTVQKGVPGTFYLTDPRKGSPAPLCTAATASTLKPGACQTLSCNWAKPSTWGVDLWFRAGDDGHGGFSENQCKSGNDVLAIRGASCKNLQ